MQWSIEFPIPKSPQLISHRDKILSMGSCFAQTIGQKMASSKFDLLINPFGTLFHPIALAGLLHGSMQGKEPDDELILLRDGLYFHYSAHTDLAGSSSQELLDKFSMLNQATSSYLGSGDYLILTLGTAWIYKLQDGSPVANCHKQPRHLFTKHLSPLNEMTVVLDSLFKVLHVTNPKLRIIVTVSPVRHIKDGVAENQLSKSLLRVLCAELVNTHPHVSYFPAYEIMMDELRDYRFYKPDRIHPTEEAENYIWEKWQHTYFSKETLRKTEEINKIHKELGHRPINPESVPHIRFLKNLLAKLERMNTEFDFSKEIASIRSQIDSSES